VASNLIRVITRGDDLGNTHSANKAIFECVTKGNLKNTSVMVNTPQIKEAAEMFVGRKDVCFGLHANINAEFDNYKWGSVLAKAEVPDLYDEEGNLFADNSLLFNRKPRVEQVIAEISAQLDLATRMGFDIKYVDQHMGFSWVLGDEAGAVANWIRSKGLINGGIVSGGVRAKKEADVEASVRNFILALKELSDGDYMNVNHPSFDDDETRILSYTGATGLEIAFDRNIDRIRLTHPDILRTYEELGIKSIRYDEV